MSNESENSTYQYNAEQYTSAAEQPQTAMKKRRLLWTIGLLVAGFLLYKGAMLLLASHQPTAQKKAKLSAVKATNTAMTTPAISKPVLTQKKDWTRPHPQAHANERQLEQLSQTVGDLNENMSNLSEALKTINDNLQYISQQVVELKSFQVAKLKKAAARKKKAMHDTKYYIQAMIPGRVWLTSVDGKTLTVGRGDHIPGYGVVKRIDERSGAMVTSSGKVIRYAVNER